MKGGEKGKLSGKETFNSMNSVFVSFMSCHSAESLSTWWSLTFQSNRLSSTSSTVIKLSPNRRISWSSFMSLLVRTWVQCCRNYMITGLQDIEKCRQQLHEINVPLEAFEYIDQGRNPQLYTKECLERALAKNEQVKGKIDTMTKFKSLLISELGKVFPEEMTKYKAIHGDDPPS
uniref:Mediator of RNA polymerase II transcription subunit 10 n=2 Tax=Oncorhynchus TaxID=8016 RepID=A0A8C7GB33_ONCKI